MSQSPRQLADELKRRARELGFDLCGIADAQPSGRREYLRAWLDSGQHGEMAWLANRFPERTDVAEYLPGARSVICVAMNYHVPLEPPANPELAGRVARYALGDDYHEHLKRRLHALADWLREVAPAAQTKACVDTAPVMEKEWAARAGVGWQGKNTCVIQERIGSWLLLGEIVTTLELSADEPATDRCGTCTRCLDACPTGAITGPYQLDASRCISYLTIEHRGDVPDEFKPQIGEWLYGCDICQDVCPWNRRAPAATDEALQPRFASGSLNIDEILAWEPEDYRRHLKGSAMKRVKLPLLQRNARIVRDNKTKPTA